MIKVIDPYKYKLRPSKHFVLDKMRKWNWDIEDIRVAIAKAKKIEKVGKSKYEVYTTHGGNRKLIFVIYESEPKEIFVITGAEG